MVAQNDFRRYVELRHVVDDLVLRGNRDAGEVARLLQVVNDHEDFSARLGLVAEPKLISDPEAEALSFSVEDWAKFYRDECGIEIEEKDLMIPAPPAFPHWLIIEPAEFTPHQGFEAMKRRFRSKVWGYTDDLDSITRLEPFKGVRCSYVRARIEADEELKSKSADDLKQESISGITLQAREALECLFFEKTGMHLDRANVTLCSGSRFPRSDVPYVNWNSHTGEVNVNWYNSDYSTTDIRSRQQFS